MSKLVASLWVGWNVELPEDVDPEEDIKDEELFEQVIVDEFGLETREDVLNYDVNVEREVVSDDS